jgi:quaternary ammonium compound-resistance protein SugE
MNWIYLTIAGLFEVGWAVGLKYSENFSKFWPTTVTVISLIMSFVLLNLSLRTIPLGIAYAAWTGIGIMGTVLFGTLCFGEPINFLKLVFFSLIISGIVGLKLLS